MDNITLKDLVDEQKYTDESDISIIKKWFIANNKEAEGINLIAELASSQTSKLEYILQYARMWIPTVPDIYESNKQKVSKDVADKLNKIVQYHLLDIPLSNKLLEWARDTIPTLKTPTIIFRPAIEWLKSEYGIEFKDKMI